MLALILWLGGRDSNPDSQIQSLESYHWTTSHRRSRIYETRCAKVKRELRVASRVKPHFSRRKSGYEQLGRRKKYLH